jgi:selenocysteine lyase/cysteine desulfurase
MAIWMDGLPLFRPGVGPPPSVDEFAVMELEAVEAYRGATDTPRSSAGPGPSAERWCCGPGGVRRRRPLRARDLMAILPSQRHLFDIPRDVAYLNCAYQSPLLREVADIGRRALARKTHPWDMVYPEDFVEGTERARAGFATLLGPPATSDDIAIVPSASYGSATAALTLPLARGQRVLVLEGEFPSTILTWRERARAVGAELVRLPVPEDHDWTRVVLDAIDGRTALAALPALHWLDGATLDLAAIGVRLREVGAALALDLTQSLGAMPFDLAAADPDFLVAACYKWLLGPYSIGFHYVAPRWHQGRPLEHNWFSRAGSEDVASLIDYPEAFRPGARRFDMGEAANFGLLPPALAAIEQILAWSVPDIYDTAGALADTIVAGAESRGWTAAPAGRRARHYVGLRATRPFPPDLTRRLAAHRVYVSVRGGRSLRITPHVYNDADDVARLFAALDQAAP